MLSVSRVLGKESSCRRCRVGSLSNRVYLEPLADKR